MKSDSTTRGLFLVLLVFVLAVAYRVIAPFLAGELLAILRRDGHGVPATEAGP